MRNVRTQDCANARVSECDHLRVPRVYVIARASEVWNKVESKWGHASPDSVDYQNEQLQAGSYEPCMALGKSAYEMEQRSRLPPAALMLQLHRGAHLRY
eukprot:6175464-Pleurochrysis_carterae.AAC.1